MKITLDIPNTTTCAFFGYVFVDEDTYGMCMGVKSICTDDLFEGNEITAETYKGGEQYEK